MYRYTGRYYMYVLRARTTHVHYLYYIQDLYYSTYMLHYNSNLKVQSPCLCVPHVNHTQCSMYTGTSHVTISQNTCSVCVYGSSNKKSPYRTPLVNVVTPWAIVFRCNVAEPAGRGGYTKPSFVANTRRPPSYSVSSFRGTCMVFNDRSV